MKYLKKYEKLDKETLDKFTTYVVATDTHEIYLLKLTDVGSYTYDRFEILYPVKSDEYFKMYKTEIYEGEYEDDLGLIWKFLFKSKNYDEAKKEYDIYKDSKKYNL